ncbi:MULTISPECIES: hypothetical protein [Idiomarina]|uniref:hypothetical protein n=1 Tax=Idiomarina TaxID=135575 RepID=UPI00129C6781|nr:MULTISPECIES: hypothetical protein [Idiomarina]MRJ43126.1 hypothetical protein [Idiomarina sp. FeN1]NCU58658.1 hypothetical protein [Idiomarina sp. FenA--70]NCU61354.1 hypothetical protein [Idiomarina sp. FenBw--71]UUN13121.1 hypothetical protein KGF88_10845 [Idiomarina loihiensis]
MSNVVFSYADFEATGFKLIDTIRRSLSEADKQFRLSFNQLEPNWSVYDYHQFPSVKWKLMNLAKFKKESPKFYKLQLEKLSALLAS